MFGFFFFIFLDVVASKHLFVWSLCIPDGSLSLTRCRGYTWDWIMFYGFIFCTCMFLVECGTRCSSVGSLQKTTYIGWGRYKYPFPLNCTLTIRSIADR